MSPRMDNHGEDEDKNSGSSTQAQASNSPRCITPTSSNCPTQYSYHNSSQDDFPPARSFSSSFDGAGGGGSTTDSTRDINRDFAELERQAEIERQARIDRLVADIRAGQPGSSSSTVTTTASSRAEPMSPRFATRLVVGQNGLLTPLDTPTPNPTPSGSHVDGDQSVEAEDQGS